MQIPPPLAGFPSACPPSAEPSGAAAPLAAARPLRVLVAEDNTINQRLITRALGQLGHTGTLVPNGEQALRALATHRFDLVLMDDHMPVMTGVQALELLRAGHPRADPRTLVIMVTANDMAGDREGYLRRGANGYLAKPVCMDRLRAEIDSVLGCHGCWPYACGGQPPRNGAPKHCLSADRVRRAASTMVPFANLKTRTEQHR
jgi:CheY-like chemotaxis protein